jgi:hypothetical protein
MTAERGIDRVLATAQGYDWVLIDTAPTMWVMAQEAIRLATLVVIPARPGFELAAVRGGRTRERAQQTYAVVFNAAPPKHGEKEALAVAGRAPSSTIRFRSGPANQRPRGIVLTPAAATGTADARANRGRDRAAVDDDRALDVGSECGARGAAARRPKRREVEVAVQVQIEKSRATMSFHAKGMTPETASARGRSP